MPLYHYTNRLSGAEIVRDGVIRAASLTLHDDFFCRDAGHRTLPMVWLTTNGTPDGTVIAKLVASGWSLDARNIWRIVLPDAYPCQCLDAYSESAGIKWERWRWVVSTARLASSDWRDWRIVPRDIPVTDWLRVEHMAGNDHWIPVPKRGRRHR